MYMVGNLRTKNADKFALILRQDHTTTQQGRDRQLRGCVPKFSYGGL